METLKRKKCPGCGVALPWEIDTGYLADFARWLSHHPTGRLFTGEDTHQFYENPREWIEGRLGGDLHSEYEKERAA